MSRKKTDISKLNLALIGDRIAYVRLHNGLSMDGFAKLIGLTKGNISNFENHKYEPSFKTIVQITEHFKINPNWLLTGKGDPHLSASANGNNGREKQSNSPGQNASSIEAKSIELFQGFRDKQRALNITHELVDLEKLDPEAFKRIETYIQATVDAIKEVAKKRIYTGSDRRRFKRRQKNISGDYSGENDRRSGMGRREEDQRGEDQAVNG